MKIPCRAVAIALPVFACSLTRADLATNLLPVADTTLQSAFPDNNFGAGTSFTSGGRNQGGSARALLKFDLAASVPAGATITAATLSLHVANANGPGSIFDLHRVTRAWGEGDGSDQNTGTMNVTNGATWNSSFFPATPWATPGGDFDDAVSASQLVDAPGDYVFTGPVITADVQAWLDAPTEDFGWALQSESEATPGTIRRFSGRLDSLNPPRLLVSYSTPIIAPPPLIFDADVINGQFRFSFEAVSGQAYEIQSRDSFDTGDWSQSLFIPAPETNTTLQVTNDITGDAQFFRVRLNDGPPPS